jgi:hypothetical protein
MATQSVADRLRATYAECLDDPSIYRLAFPTKVSANAETDDYQVPDFAALYPSGSVLPARLAYLLWFNATYLADVFADDGLFRETLPQNVLDYLKALPDAASTQWLERFCVGFLRIADAMERAQVPKPRCTGEEMALHIVLEFVAGDTKDVSYLYGDDADFAELPPVANYNIGMDAVLDWMEDEDILLSFDFPADQLEALMAFGTLNLIPSKWFLPFQP